MKKSVLSNLALVAVPAVALLTACGGGGGSGGTGPGGGNTSKTEIFLRSEKSDLSMNLTGIRPGAPWNYSGTGRNAPYTTTLTVEAKVEGRYIPSSGEDAVFSCSLDGAGIEIGSLYYLDGKDEHQVEVTLEDGSKVKVPGAYRSIALPSFGGLATFHFHAANGTVGDATVLCSYTDPRDKQVRTASTTIRVGPRDVNRLPSVSYIESSSTGERGYLYTQGSGNNTQLLLNAKVWADLDQPVANPPAGVHNLYARIIRSHSAASRGAQLRGSGSKVFGDGSTIAVSTINGLATFSLTSGQYAGPILLEFIADRADNNVSNGIMEPVSNFMVVYAVDEPPPSVVPELEVASGQSFEGKVGQPFTEVLTLSKSGLPPHRWSVVGAQLPSGLTLQSDGMITGVPLELVSARTIKVSVTDSTNKYAPWRENQVAYGEFAITVAESPYSPHIRECGASVDLCNLPDVTVGQNFVHVLTGAGGNGIYTWAIGPASNLPNFLGFANGVLSGTPGTDVLACPSTTPKIFEFVIDVTSAHVTKKQKVQLKVVCP